MGVFGGKTSPLLPPVTLEGAEAALQPDSLSSCFTRHSPECDASPATAQAPDLPAPSSLDSGAVSPVCCLVTMARTLGPEFSKHLLVQSAQTAQGCKDLKGQVLTKVTGSRRPKHRSCPIPGHHLTLPPPQIQTNSLPFQALPPCSLLSFGSFEALFPWPTERVLTDSTSASNKSSSPRENQQKSLIPNEEMYKEPIQNAASWVPVTHGPQSTGEDREKKRRGTSGK